MKGLVNIQKEMNDALYKKIWQDITQVLRVRVINEFEDYDKWFLFDGDIWEEITTIISNVTNPIDNVLNPETSSPGEMFLE